MNSFKAIFQNMSSWVQLLFLLIFASCGIVIASTISGIIAFSFAPDSGNMVNMLAVAMSSPSFLWISQFLTQIFLFLMPAVLCAWLFNQDGAKYLKISKAPKLKITLASIISIFTIQPLINFTSYYNSQMKLPESMAGIEQWMKNYEDQARTLMEQMLGQPSASALIVNLFIIAVMAGITEEFLFRGALQQIFNRITSNYHVAIWISAFIFSAIHFQFYGFVPRLLLGALLGYIFVWSGNLWVPVIVHTVNNAVSVLLFKAYHGTPQYEEIENFGTKDFWWLAIISVVLTAVIFSYMHKQYTLRMFKRDNIE